MKNFFWLILSLSLFLSFSNYALSSDQQTYTLSSDQQKKEVDNPVIKKKKKKRKKRRKKAKEELRKSSEKKSKGKRKTEQKSSPAQVTNKIKKTRPQAPTLSNSSTIKPKLKCLDCKEEVTEVRSHYGSPFILCPECMQSYIRDNS
jgi:formylmethanofuran dehydrogenase subunit E